MTFEKSDVDDRYYMVRNLDDKQTAANILSYNREKIIKLINYLNTNKTKYKEYADYIDRLVEKVIDVNIVENNGEGKETSYSVNKGEELILCLRSKINKDILHDNNLLFYVILHELSHIASPVYEDEYNNHGPIFKKIFSFLTNVAIEIRMYEKIDFGSNQKEYCGIYITDSIV
jgi:hypothetical protein